MNETISVVTATPVRRRRRWPWALGLAGVIAAGSLSGVLLLSHHGPKPVTAACQRAVAAQNQFVDDATAQGYPNVDIATGMAVIAADLKLLNNMTTAGCAPTTLVKVLPGS